jgi:hypothetical protein
VGALNGGEQGFLDEGFRISGLFGDDFVGAEDVVPGKSVGTVDGTEEDGYHSVSAFGLSIGTLTGMSILTGSFRDNV